MKMIFTAIVGLTKHPFDDREAALAAEVAWLHEHHIPDGPTAAGRD